MRYYHLYLWTDVEDNMSFYLIYGITNMNKQEYVQLVHQLNEYSRMYHLDNSSPIPDSEYDMLYKKMVEYEVNHPENVIKESPSQRVGEPTDNKFDKVKHLFRMYSLENAFTKEDIEKYLKRFAGLRKTFGSTKVDNYYVDYKMDGLSCELIYDDGRLKMALTRGNGLEGEDVTANVMTIPNVPHEIRYHDQLVVQGEVVVHREDFLAVNNDRKHKGLPLFSNCRNYASGSLRQKDPEITKERDLKFYAWKLYVPGAKKMTHEQSVQVLIKLGFSVPKGTICTNIDEILNTINEINHLRSKLPFDIDGAVIKQNDPDFYKAIGWNNHAPLFNIAYKFVAQELPTTITAINWSMGRSGKLTPVAVIEPVTLSGAIINNVTLNNADYIEKNRIAVGTEVLVKRSAEVIPKIAAVTNIKGNVTFPSVCPFCGSKLVRNGPELKCVNPDCKEKLIMQLSFLISKDCMNIKGYGEKFIREAVNSETFTKFTDIFQSCDTKSKTIKQTDLNDLINKARNITLADLLTVIGIPNCGRSVAFKLVEEEYTLAGVKKLFLDNFRMRYLTISNSSRNNILKWVSNPKNMEFLDTLIDLKLPKC